jgi:hypothetical protein
VTALSTNQVTCTTHKCAGRKAPSHLLHFLHDGAALQHAAHDGDRHLFARVVLQHVHDLRIAAQ